MKQYKKGGFYNMDYKKIINENIKKLEEIDEKKGKLWQTIRENRDKARTNWGEYEKIYNEIITPAEKQNELETIKKELIYNNFAVVSYELFKTEFLAKLQQFKNKNIGEKTREKIQDILQNILKNEGLNARAWYEVHAFHNSNDLTFNFLLLDKEGYTHGNDSEFLTIRLEIPTSFHLFDKIEEAETCASTGELIDVDKIDETAEQLKKEHDDIQNKIEEARQTLANLRTEYNNKITNNLNNKNKYLYIDYEIKIY